MNKGWLSLEEWNIRYIKRRLVMVSSANRFDKCEIKNKHKRKNFFVKDEEQL